MKNTEKTTTFFNAVAMRFLFDFPASLRSYNSYYNKTSGVVNNKKENPTGTDTGRAFTKPLK